MLLELLGASAGAFAVGFAVARRRHRRAPAAIPAELSVPAKRSEEQYKQDRTFYIEMYRASMQQYDRLVPWTAGGALVLSITFLHDVASAPSVAQLRVLLGVGWLCLVLSLASSVISHFTSSRIYSSMRKALDLVHRGDGSESSNAEAAKYYRLVQVNGRRTQGLNYVSGGGLLAGLGLLAVFAYLSL